jgi:hypothetical protein
MTSYFSDRERGPQARTREAFTDAAWGGVVAAVDRRISTGAFGSSFPDECSDGHGTAGTSAYSMGLAVMAEIPMLADAEATQPTRWGDDRFSGWPLRADRLPPTLAILDLIEFCYRHVAEPTEIDYHSYLRHSHLRFDQAAGRSVWLTEINGLFGRNGLAYELTPRGEVVRLGTPISTDAVRRAVFATGDTALDGLLDRARQKYLSADPTHRGESLEQLWDAFERSKTILDRDKRVGMRALIDQVASSRELADRFEAEAHDLTRLGNDFRIRHHETTKTPLDISDVDYLFHRCFALLAHLLRLNPAP